MFKLNDKKSLELSSEEFQQMATNGTITNVTIKGSASFDEMTHLKFIGCTIDATLFGPSIFDVSFQECTITNLVMCVPGNISNITFAQCNVEKNIKIDCGDISSSVFNTSGSISIDASNVNDCTFGKKLSLEIESTKISNSTFEECRFKKSNISAQKMVKCSFKESNLKNLTLDVKEMKRCDFRKADLESKDISNIKFKRCNFRKANLKKTTVNSSFVNNKLAKSQIKGMKCE